MQEHVLERDAAFAVLREFGHELGDRVAQAHPPRIDLLTDRDGRQRLGARPPRQQHVCAHGRIAEARAGAADGERRDLAPGERHVDLRAQVKAVADAALELEDRLRELAWRRERGHREEAAQESLAHAACAAEARLKTVHEHPWLAGIAEAVWTLPGKSSAPVVTTGPRVAPVLASRAITHEVEPCIIIRTP